MAVNPLEELSLYPNMMKWRGTWISSEQYFQNDIVISPINTAPYILIGETALISILDPSLDPLWEELAPSITGVASIQAGAGITVVNPTGPVTQVINDGVITIIPGSNISINNTDPQNPIVSTSNVVTGVQAGPGISVSGLTVVPTITNVGVRTLAVGAGLLSNNDPNNPSITTSAVLTITPSTGISVTPGQTPTISNTGVITVTAGNGITVNNTVPTAPVISNSGVITVTAGNNITITGTTQNPIISSNSPVLTQMSFIPAGFGPVVPSGEISFDLLPITANIFFNYFLNGSPDPTGIFMLDLTTVNLFMSATTPPVVGDKIGIVLVDDITTAPIPIAINIEDLKSIIPNNTYPFQTRPGLCYLNIDNIRNTGFRVPTKIIFQNLTSAADLEANSYADIIYATYYPAGLQ